ncbi:F-box/kelch-repeat protein At5g15710 [Physcomitrium patens]|uniref:F-box domain-containing protein n=1 Tax=Physcomitrium patens TaxID=3218 RepID=A0A2K1K287_PHYPA|nr:F-box only protein 6-like [Physcomitrium patens]XP_024384265.1 F-box only protein 6-like [Physcomitrium patens]PNR47891.1 hypothetical protein PHYPA_012364 [Physcomitrium patens]|eukprot:XP_024384264.1 F-box only protein 6-like [Physcomitrella patens]
MPMSLAHQGVNFHNIFSGCGSEPLLNPDAQPPRISDSQLDGGAVLHPAIWSNLPESILHSVFSKLSLKNLTRIRSLNKLWKSTDFFSNGVNSKKTGRFALLRGGQDLASEQHEVWVFDTPAQEWCKFNLGHFPSSLVFKGPFAAAGGLLCYISQTSHGGKLKLIVSNPLMRTWRLLPPNLNLCDFPTLTHMSYLLDQYSITLVGLCEDTGAMTIEIYESGSNTWTSTDHPPQLTSYYNFFKEDDYLGLATIDMRSKSIMRIMYPYALQKSGFLSRDEDKCWILESKGGLFMCSNAPRREGIWQRLETEWKRVCVLPKQLHKYERTDLYISEDVVLLVGSEPRCFLPQFEDEDPHKLIVFNKETCRWSILPQISSNFGTLEELLRGLIFEPRFDTKP